MDGPENMMTDVFEKSHKLFRDHYKKSLKRIQTRTAGTLKLQEDCFLCKETAALKENGRRVTKNRKLNIVVDRNHTLCIAVRVDPAFLVGVGPWKILQGILLMRLQLNH